MKKMHVAIAALTLGATAFLAQPVFASTTLTFYSFSNWGISGSSSIYSNNSFSVTNPYHVVTIKGWQNTANTSTTASVEYMVVQKGFPVDIKYGSTVITGDSSQSNTATWYSFNFSNIPYNSGYYIKLGAITTDYMNGAGNAYDGY